MKSRFLGILSLLLLTLALTACNGSSDSSSSSSSSASAGGAVASVPLVGAEVWSYNAEGVAIQIGKTLGNGSIKFYSAALSEVQFPNAIVFSKGGHSYINDSAADFAGTLKGVMASSTSKVYLTPANTLVAALVEEGVTLAEAKTRVRKAVNVEMGINIDPFANPIENVTESEIVAQTILAVLGIREDAAADLDEYLEAIAADMADDETFATAVKANATTSPLNDTEYSGKSLFTIVKDITETEIMSQVKDVLSSEDGDTYYDSSVIEEQEKEIEEAIEQKVPVAIAATAGTDVPEFYAVTGGGVESVFTFEVLSNKVDSDGKPVAFTTEDAEYPVVLVAFDGVGTLEQTGANEFTYTLEADGYDAADLPLDVTAVLRSAYDPSVTKTITITLVSNTALVVENVQFDLSRGKGHYTFDDAVDGKIVDGSSCALADSEFVAEVKLVSDVGDISDNVDVRFFAPTGFKFEHGEGVDAANTDSYTVTTTTPYVDPTKHHANILAAHGVKLVAVLGADETIEPGRKEIGIQVLDTANNNAVLKTASAGLVFVPAGMENDLRTATLESAEGNGLTITTATIAKDEIFAPAKISLAGSYKTWVKEANPENTTDGITALPADAKVILMSTTGADVFDDGFGTAVDRIEIPVTLTEDFSFTSDVTNFKYIYGDANDDIKMVFMLDPSDSNNNIESSSVLKLRFEPEVAP